MFFWIAAAVLTVCAMLAVLLPVLRPADTVVAGDSFDLEVYRDQLSELERDAERGLIDQKEADEARAEIGRRILGLDGKGTAAQQRKGYSETRWVALVAVLLVPLAGWGIYGSLGSPDKGDQPLRQRIAERQQNAPDLAQAPILELIARAEQQLSANPEDGRGWAVLAPVYLRTGRFDDAITAFRRSLTLLGSNTAYEAGLGEALVGQSGGVVTAEAQAAFERALALDPRDLRSRYYLATAYVQDGRLEEAAQAWTQLLNDTEGNAAWRQSAQAALAETRRMLAMRSAGAPASGPDQDMVDAAADMSAEDRNEMIAAMVARLDERLRGNADDLQGWKRLVRSYLVLGKQQEAQDALSRGVSALGDNSGELVAFGKSLGLQPVEQQ